jgi:hypothetical protein
MFESIYNKCGMWMRISFFEVVVWKKKYRIDVSAFPVAACSMGFLGLGGQYTAVPLLPVVLQSPEIDGEYKTPNDVIAKCTGTPVLNLGSEFWIELQVANVEPHNPFVKFFN